MEEDKIDKVGKWIQAGFLYLLCWACGLGLLWVILMGLSVVGDIFRWALNFNKGAIWCILVVLAVIVIVKIKDAIRRES